MCMRIVSLRQVETRMESSLSKFGESLHAEVQAGRHELNVAFLQSVVHHTLVLFRQNTARRINLNESENLLGLLQGYSYLFVVDGIV